MGQFFNKDNFISIGKKLLFWWFLLGGVHLLISIILVTGYGYWALAIPTSFVLAAFWSGVFIIMNVSLLIFSKHRQNSLHHIIAIVIALILVPPTLLGTWHVKLLALNLAGQRSASIIEAIEKYKENEGVPPKNLKALTPKYLDYIPRNIPKYSISKFKNGWCLSVNASNGILHYNAFMYCSDENFPENIDGSYITLGKWIYHLDN